MIVGILVKVIIGTSKLDFNMIFTISDGFDTKHLRGNLLGLKSKWSKSPLSQNISRQTQSWKKRTLALDSAKEEKIKVL